jgi:predicted RNase H-like HicB family nuclease
MTQRVYYGTVCEGGGTFGIVFLDFLGCVSAGDTLEEVIVNGHEALQGHIEAMVADGETIPDPSAVTIDRTERELDDPGEPIDDERWIEVVPIVVDVPDQLDTIPVPVQASLIAEIGKIAHDNQAFIAEAIRRRLDERKEDAA